MLVAAGAGACGCVVVGVCAGVWLWARAWCAGAWAHVCVWVWVRHRCFSHFSSISVKSFNFLCGDSIPNLCQDAWSTLRAQIEKCCQVFSELYLSR